MNHYLYSHGATYQLDQSRYWRIKIQDKPAPNDSKNDTTAQARPKRRVPNEKRPAARPAAPLSVNFPDEKADPLEVFLRNVDRENAPIVAGSKWRKLLDSSKEQRAALLTEAEDCERKFGSRFVRECADALSGQFKSDPTGIWIGNIARLPTARMAVALYHFSKVSCASLNFNVGQRPLTGSNSDFPQLIGLSLATGASPIRLELADENPEFPDAPANRPHPKTIRVIGSLRFQSADGPIALRNGEFVAEIGEANPPWIYDLLVNGYGVLRWPSKCEAITLLYPILPSDSQSEML